MTQSPDVAAKQSGRTETDASGTDSITGGRRGSRGNAGRLHTINPRPSNSCKTPRHLVTFKLVSRPRATFGGMTRLDRRAEDEFRHIRGRGKEQVYGLSATSASSCENLSPAAP